MADSEDVAVEAMALDVLTGRRPVGTLRVSLDAKGPTSVSYVPDLPGQLDPMLLDAARRAGLLLERLSTLEIALEAVAHELPVQTSNALRARSKQLEGIGRHVAELRDLIRPVARLDVEARRRAEAEVQEAEQRVANAKNGSG